MTGVARDLVRGVTLPADVTPVARGEDVVPPLSRWPGRLRADKVGMVCMAIVAFFLVLVTLSGTGLIAGDWQKEVGVPNAAPTFIGAQPASWYAERGAEYLALVAPFKTAPDGARDLLGVALLTVLTEPPGEVLLGGDTDHRDRLVRGAEREHQDAVRRCGQLGLLPGLEARQRPGGRLAQLGKALTERPGLQLTVVGHSDVAGERPAYLRERAALIGERSDTAVVVRRVTHRAIVRVAPMVSYGASEPVGFFVFKTSA